MRQDPLLDISSLSVALPPGADRAMALRGVSIQVAKNEIVCVVGESGSGKSMTASAVMGLLPPGVTVAGGTIRLDGENLLQLRPGLMRRIRGVRIGMIFQEPMTALNPLRTSGDQISEMFLHHTDLMSVASGGAGPESAPARSHRRSGSVRARYPHELSGGQRQRAMIAMAMALDPRC